MRPLLRDDADLLRERRAAHRARVHDGRRRRARPLAPPARRRRRLPHRHRRARPQDPAGRRGAGRRARRSGPTDAASVPRRVEAARHHQRRLHPHHRAPPPHGGAGSSSSASTTTATSSSTPTRASTASRCELYYTEDELVDGNCPIHGTPGRARHRGELLLPALALRGPPARALHRASRGGAARARRNEVLGFISRASATSR